MATKPDYTEQDMIGTRDPKTGRRNYPAITIGYRHYLPNACVRIRLDATHFCVKDPVLPHAESVAQVNALKALISKSSRSKVTSSDES